MELVWSSELSRIRFVKMTWDRCEYVELEYYWMGYDCMVLDRIKMDMIGLNRIVYDDI